MDDTDRILEEMIERVTEVYQQAAEESTDRLVQFMETFEREDFQMQQHLAAGLVTQEEYERWYRDQMVRSNQYQAVRNAISADLLNADKIAASIVNGHLPDIYALNVNQAQYGICHQLGYDFDPMFTLYDRFTVEGLIRDGHRLFPTANIDEDQDLQYIDKHIHNSITQGILQGESIDTIARRMQGVAGMSQSSAIRTARTLTTSAQNAGRVDSYRHAQDLGIDLQQEWLATRDKKTRDSHRLLDGVRVPVGAKFPNGLRYPGDPDGAPEEVYNCRCTLVAALEGIDTTNEDRWSNLPDDMTYEEWKEGHRPDPTPDRTTNYVHGNDISRTWERRPDEYQFAIQDVIAAQGFDGLPRVVSEEEFNNAVEESGFVAQRVYSALDQEMLEAYREQLYRGEWYVDCSGADAWFGRGMYCASSYDGTLTVDILRQEEMYRELGYNRLKWNSAQMSVTPELLAQEVQWRGREFTQHEVDLLRDYILQEGTSNQNYPRFMHSLSEDDRAVFDRLTFPYDYSSDYVEAARRLYNSPDFGSGIGSYTEMFTLSPSANVVDYNTVLSEYAEFCGISPYDVDWRAVRSGNVTTSTSFEDLGAFAASRGYDAIKVDGVEEPGRCETVILNRTALIIKEP